MITPDVSALRDELGIPGARVLQFAFDGQPDNIHLPHTYTTTNRKTPARMTTPQPANGTKDSSHREQRYVWTYLKRGGDETRDAARELIRLAWSSPAALAVAPFQDLLNLGAEGRVNVPGVANGNWRWRATRHMLSTSRLPSGWRS